jgi:hypothetical protein
MYSGGAKGTRVTVITPASGVANISLHDYFLAASFAQADQSHTAAIQVGVTYEYQAAEYYNCDKGTPSAKLYYYSEVYSDLPGDATCYYLGGAPWSSNHLMRVSQNANGNWDAYKDEVYTGVSQYWSDCNTRACIVAAFGEELGFRAGFWRSVFGVGQTGDQPFQYSANGSTWTTVTSPSPVCPGSSGCDNADWYFTGTFPTGRWSATYCNTVTCISAPGGATGLRER